MHSSTSRRTLVKGAAWAAPVVLATTTIPAYAASTQLAKGLQGQILGGKTCNTTTPTINIDGSQTAYPTGGLWVSGVQATDVVANASITFYFPTTLGRLTWVNTRLQADPTYKALWSTPTIDTTAPQRTGYYAYTMRYSGGWTYNATDHVYIADVPPKFTARITSTQCGTKYNVYTYRSVTVNGTQYTLTKGPVSI